MENSPKVNNLGVFELKFDEIKIALPRRVYLCILFCIIVSEVILESRSKQVWYVSSIFISKSALEKTFLAR